MRVEFFTRCLLFSVAIFVILYVCTFDSYTSERNVTISRKTTTEKVMEAPDNSSSPDQSLSNFISFDSIFIYKAYIYNRLNETRIRVLTINKCLPNKTRFLGFVGNQEISFVASPVENECPWHWAPGCSLVSYVMESEPILSNNLEEVADKELTLMNDNSTRTVTMSITATTELEHGLTVCVPPLYWYTDWTKLILFIEWWKLQGTSRFIIYYFSSSKEVRTVLDHYVAEGIVELVPWPKLPSSASFDPNQWVYRLGHTLAHNDCLMRIGTNYAVNLDIDEMLLTGTTPLLAFAHSMFTSHPGIGSLSFSHHNLVYRPAITSSSYKNFDFEKLDYRGITNAAYSAAVGPTKVIFQTKYVRRLSTHKVLEYTSKKWKEYKVPVRKGMLLHNRYTIAWNTSTELKAIDIFPKGTDQDLFRSKLEEKKNRIFPNGATFHRKTQNDLGKCLATWRTSQSNCKSPVTGCRNAMMGLEDWVEQELTTDIVL